MPSSGVPTEARLTGEDKEELLRLCKEVKKLRIENEILKKASAYFAKEMKFLLILVNLAP
jgi:transposase-like protein